MPVKPNQSASRVLGVLEAIAGNQPVGVSELSRLLGADKSAVQRAIMTLVENGWIAIAPGATTRWELTAHIFSVAYRSQSKNDWRQRARHALEALRDRTGESALLTAPDVHHFVVVEVVESRQGLRTTSTIGTIVPPQVSATGYAVLPYMSKERQIEMLGSAPDKELLEHYRATRQRGYSVSVDLYIVGATNIAAPVFEADGRPVAAVVITGPTKRLNAKVCAKIGKLVVETARSLSRGQPAANPMIARDQRSI